MENDEEMQATVDAIYEYAVDLLVKQGKSSREVQELLVQQGVNEGIALTVVENLQVEIGKANKKRGQKNMMFGAMWFIGGTIATLANVGFIFYGAIIIGAIQFIAGLVSYSKN